MTATVPTNEPQQLRAGNTWAWTRKDLSDYPASAWTLKYAFKNAAQHFEATAIADGDGYAVTIAMATTAGYTAGNYRWDAWVESATERYDVDTGWLEVLPKYNSTTVLDDREHARIVLDAIEAVIEGRATKDQQEYTIGTRTLKRMSISDLLMFRDKYRAEVYALDNAERVANGQNANQLVWKL